jgi:hypothetical protein
VGDEANLIQRKQGAQRIFMSVPEVDRKRQVFEMNVHGGRGWNLS